VSLLSSLLIAAARVGITIVIHYEALRLISHFVSRSRWALRLRVLFVVLCCFAAHAVEIWVYAGAYLAMDYVGVGSLAGKLESHAGDYLYFSAITYSTLGFGDIYPEGMIRLVAGFEAVNGLFLIAWSTSFTYLAMERLWPLHSRIAGDDDATTGKE
jgi:hypothetical protein